MLNSYNTVHKVSTYGYENMFFFLVDCQFILKINVNIGLTICDMWLCHDSCGVITVHFNMYVISYIHRTTQKGKNFYYDLFTNYLGIIANFI